MEDGEGVIDGVWKTRRFMKRDIMKRKERNDKIEGHIATMVQRDKEVIRYDRMNGRPSVEVSIMGQKRECLLDTGASANVMNWTMFQELPDAVLEESHDTLRCANDSLLNTKGKTTVNVEFGDKKQPISFIVVQHMVPSLIGGIEFQNKFGFALQCIATNELDESEDENSDYVCNIEARFGRIITGNERLKRAERALGNADPVINEIIKKYQNVFMADKWDIGCTPLVKHKIQTRGGPINVKPYRQPVNLEEKIEKAIQNLWENGIIAKCNSPWNTPLICVWKKESQEIRLCLDFRQLNLITERQAFPMPNINEMLDRLNGSRYFSSIDLGNAYYQVELDDASKPKTAFSTKTGQYCFNRMPFGIAAGPGTFQELMEKVVGTVKGALVYLDDILIFTDTIEKHYTVLEDVLRKIDQAGLRINPEKCHILKKEIKFLGHILNKDGIQTDPAKLEAIMTYQKPKCIKGLRSFLGICNYYRRFIRGYAVKSRALEELCGRNNKKLIWTDTCNVAFSEMKEALVKSPVLGYPDVNKDFILDTDASFNTIGAVLSQKDDSGRERVIAYGSHAMSNHEKGYCITRKELLAIYYFCQHFNHYLYGRRFTLRTDHKAITFMLSTKKPITTQFQTWINYLSSLDIKLQYRKGAEHSNADLLSRTACETCTQCLQSHEEAKTDKLKTRRINVTETKESNKWQKDSSEIEELKQKIKDRSHWKFVLIGQDVKTKEGKLWIPEARKKEMIKEMHILLSHAGSEKVTKYIVENYDMSRIKETVKEVLKMCDACARTKVVTVKTKEETIQLSAKEPWEKIYIDICGPLPETFKKKKYILAIIDQFSRYISLTPIAKQDEATVKSIIKDKWVLRFGAPKEIHVDCGKVFEAKSVKELCQSMGIELHFSSPYHHNTNGIIERQFRTIRDFINASLLGTKGKDWESLLPEIEFTLNATVQKTTGKSPAEIGLGRKIFREGWFGKEEKQTETQESYETKRTFKVGDDVLVEIENRSKDKERYGGPYQIIEKIHDRRYRLRDKDGNVIQRNVEKLRAFLKEGGCEVI